MSLKVWSLHFSRGDSDRYLLPTFAVMGLTSVGLVLMYRGSLTKFMQTAAVLTLGLICFNVVHIGVNTLREPARQSGADQSGNVILPPREGTDRLPDIYFIVLDSYGRADVLEEIYDFDNHEFIESLTQKGFFVASGSRSNYITTEPSLAASLNMRYHGEWEDFYSLVQENLVVALAQSFGYKYVHVGSGWLVTMRSTHADVEILYGIRFPLLQSEFMAVLVSKTLASTLGGLVDIRPSDAFVGIVANRFNYNMKQIPDIADLEGPTFTFSHNFPPHPPFVFDRNGNLPQRSKLRFTGSVWRDSDLYIDQLYYVNKTVDAVVEGILKRSPEEPVIIIHGDHGPSHGGNVDFKKPSDSFIFERTGIFSAYYLPEHCRSGLYAAISPVNNFRMVFDSCLGTNFGLSEDKTHWSVGGPPIDFSRIMR